ncbi:hypothetical protein TARUN_2674 [Trichoderma arundinaceum]|uniref:EH domain-containing protein n=1 Tax=Trichoderma arundinaceum TaxID=490622 RepID=A0A395NU85_TRIAR|nr:hypothetical protein TARUN_2674 [Trichoderma arundinaceum]
MKPTDSAAAAIRGATLAFQRDKLEQRQGQEQELSRQQSARHLAGRDNGAFTAATEAVRSTGASGTNIISRNTTGSRAPARTASTTTVAPSLSEYGGGAVGLDARPQQLDRHASGGGASAAFASQAGYLGLAPAPQGRMDAKNQSLIAATLAASRSTSPTAGAKTVRRAESVGAMSSASSGGSTVMGEAVDSGPLASAGSLISMFEKARGGRPSPPESVASGAEDKTPAMTAMAKEKGAAAAGKAGQKKKSKNNPVKGDVRPPTPPPATKTRRGPMAETGSESKPRAPADDGKSKAMAGVSAPHRSGSLASPTTQKQQQQQNQHQQQHPTRSKENNKAASPPRLPASPRRPMTPTSISATQPSTPAPSSEPKSRPKSSQARSDAVPRALQPSTPPPLKPLMTRNVAEVVSPQPTRVSRTPLSPVTSPHLTLSPSIHIALASPSPDPQKKTQSSTTKRPPTPPKPRGSGKGVEDKDRPARRGRSHSHHLDASASSQTRASVASAISRSAGQSVSPASGQQTESRPSSVFLARRHSIVSAPSSPSRELASRRRLANGSPSHTQLDNLTDAIVAGSLASSRLTPHNTGSSSLVPPPLPKRQKSPRLLHTLRQPHNISDEEEDQHKKGHRALLRKGKHAHHEGSRKKWREEIRPRERKRYEALWASNRGILLTDTRMMSPATSISSDLDRDVSQCVANVVVREVWKRSRLPMDELAEIYDLVDRGRAGMLSRAEFVVGTWLVDQRLKGRKVPAKVTDSVWGSANGVMVKGPNGK